MLSGPSGAFFSRLAMLAVRARDIAVAEDALSEAFLSALRTWPERGVPQRPDAWLMTVARNALKNRTRHRSRTLVDGGPAP